MQLRDLVETSRRVSETPRRLEKIEHLAACLRRLEPSEVGLAVTYLSGHLPQGRIGVGPAALRRAMPATGTQRPSLTLSEVDAALGEIAATSGSGTAARRLERLRELLRRATGEEQRFLAALLLGELRQGASGGLMAEAIARAAEVPAASIRRALMITGDPAVVARAALGGGREQLGELSLQLFRPVEPMLAQSADGVAAALQRLERAALELKLDGARIQVHKGGDDVRVFSRRLRDVTRAVPEIVERIRALPARQLILDGEVVALRADGTPLPFQTTMRRFGRKLDVEEIRQRLPLTPFFFDCLHADGDDLIDRPGGERFAALADLLPAASLTPRTVTADPQEAAVFLEDALRHGHEGVMAKSLQAPYEAGRRGQTWLKIKPAHTLDLVVLAAEWGHGRRRGWLSNLHLGARDADSGDFVMLGKTFKGLTDEMLRWQTEKLQELATQRERYTVFVRPELVVEVAFNDIQNSPHYPAGMALRFARVKRYRRDKKPSQADTVETVRALYHQQTGVD